MPDKQQGFLLGRLIVEEYRDEADSFILPKGNAAGSPFLLYGLYMTLNLRGILRLHRGIQCAEICKAASSQRIGICFQRFLVHKQHIFTSIDLSVCAHGENFSGMLIEVRNAEGVKCPRCWMHSTKANADGLCPRCAAVVAAQKAE